MEQNAAPREWSAFSEERNGTFVTIEKWVEAMLFSGVPQERIVKVRLIEDPAGDFAGWLDANENGEICMVQHKRVFPIQFPYGVQAAEENGDGKAVSLRIEIA